MLVEFETTTEIAACVLHELTAKIIRTPPVYRFVLQVQNNLKKYHSELKIVLPKQKGKDQTQSLQLCWHRTCQHFGSKFAIWLAK